MSTTTIKVDTNTRDRLAAVAREQGISQDAALQNLLDEHVMAQVHAQYARLRNDPEAWADYTDEINSLDGTAGDGLGDARAEYPEYNR